LGLCNVDVSIPTLVEGIEIIENIVRKISSRTCHCFSKGTTLFYKVASIGKGEVKEAEA
jgi:hypothetical protein